MGELMKMRIDCTIFNFAVMNLRKVFRHFKRFHRIKRIS